jgi:hypothetical protein
MWMMALVTVAAFGLIFAAMAVGLLRGKALRGSCGGVGAGACVCSPAQQADCELHKVKEAIERRALESAANPDANED